MLSKRLVVLELLLCFNCLLANTQNHVIDEIVGRVRQNSGKLLIASDFNGVLVDGKNTDINWLKSNVIVPVTETQKFTLYVSSSKPSGKLNELLGNIPKLGLSAEHNMQVRHPGSNSWHSKIDAKYAKQVLDYIQSLAEREGYKLQKDKANHLKTHVYSRNFCYPEWKSDDVDSIQNWFDSALENTGFEAVINTDSRKRTIMVASELRGKENLLHDLFQQGKFKSAIALGDKAADMNAVQLAQLNGFIGILVGPQLETAAYENRLYHLESVDDVHKLFVSLVNLKN